MRSLRARQTFGPKPIYQATGRPDGTVICVCTLTSAGTNPPIFSFQSPIFSRGSYISDLREIVASHPQVSRRCGASPSSPPSSMTLRNHAQAMWNSKVIVVDAGCGMRSIPHGSIVPAFPLTEKNPCAVSIAKILWTTARSSEIGLSCPLQGHPGDEMGSLFGLPVSYMRTTIRSAKLSLTENISFAIGYRGWIYKDSLSDCWLIHVVLKSNETRVAPDNEARPLW